VFTEHVRDIREWYESDNTVLEPEYDEFSLYALADDLNIAYQSKSNIRISYWRNNWVKEHERQIYELLSNEQAIRII